MIPCISVENMRRSDAYTIANFVPGLELMRRAAMGVFMAYHWSGSTAIVVGSGNNLDATFTKDGAVVAVACEFYPDENTLSGYYWSNEKGASEPVTNGSLVTAKIITEKVRPITKLFSKLADIWGD